MLEPRIKYGVNSYLFQISRWESSVTRKYL